MTEKEDVLKKIFKTDEMGNISDVFLEEQELIKNLLEEFRKKNLWYEAGSSAYESALEKPLELAINSKNTWNLISSNTKLSESNEKYQKALNWLTWWLVFVGVIQIVMQVIQIFKK